MPQTTNESQDIPLVIRGIYLVRITATKEELENWWLTNTPIKPSQIRKVRYCNCNIFITNSKQLKATGWHIASTFVKVLRRLPDE